MPRAIWTGTISFGLVTIPVRLVTAVRDKSIHFNMLSPEGDCRLRRKLYCPDTEKEYDFKDTARGYEIAPDQYVIIDDEELERLKPENGRTIDISEFIELKQVDPIYFDRTYYLIPDSGGAKAYRLLEEAMKESRRAAIATFVMRQKQHLVVLRSREGAIILHTMHYADEVTQVSDLGLDEQHVEVSKKEMDVARRLIEALEADFDPEQYEDTYRKEIEKLIEAKAEGEEISLAPEAPEEEPRVINIMEALQQSLEQAGGSSNGRKKKSSRKKKSA